MLADFSAHLGAYNCLKLFRKLTKFNLRGQPAFISSRTLVKIVHQLKPQHRGTQRFSLINHFIAFLKIVLFESLCMHRVREFISTFVSRFSMSININLFGGLTKSYNKWDMMPAYLTCLRSYRRAFKVLVRQIL